MSILEFLMIMINVHLALSDRNFAILQQCQDYNAESNVNLDEIRGKWFVVEVIIHNHTDYNTFNLMSNFDQIDIIKSDQHGQRNRNDNLRIMLYEHNNLSNNIKGRLSIYRQGYFLAYMSRSDSHMEDYEVSPNAAIQVLRKTDRYMVWHFCANPIFSVYMVRNFDVPPTPEITKEVHDLLRRKRLEIISVEPRHSRNSANMITFVIYFHIVLIFLCRLFQ